MKLEMTLSQAVEAKRASRGLAGGIFFVALATLMYEILLTRIFSVTMWFHFAFLAISIAMFGLTFGATIVYLFPSVFSGERIPKALSIGGLATALAIVVSFVAHLYIPFLSNLGVSPLFCAILTYLVIALPFTASGICICLVLTKFSRDVGRFYASDLAGASLGCVLIALILGMTDAPSAVFIVAACAAVGALFFSSLGAGKRWFRTSLVTAVCLLLVGVFHGIFAGRDLPIFRLFWVRGALEGKPLYEKWNSFSRVTVNEHKTMSYKPFGWGLSSTYEKPRVLKELMLTIDSGAATPITEFNPDWTKYDFLKSDIINIVHYLRPNADVLAVGTGGGRDVLSALAFGQKSVTGVEINGAIIEALNKKFGDFSGHLDRLPNVKFINDEARSYIARSKQKVDIIQISMIDTNAATVAGAYAFTENSLYTVEAYETFLRHLTPGGILSVSRWYTLNLSGETYRNVAIAVEALKKTGVVRPRDHIIVVRNLRPGSMFDVGTLLVSNAPFSAFDVGRIEALCRRFNYQVILSPRVSVNPFFALLASGNDATELFKRFPLNIAPTTDDHPFFFHAVRLKDAFNKDLEKYGKLGMFNIDAVFVLNRLIFVVVLLTFLAIILPLCFSFRRFAFKGTLMPLIFFASIGAGFMFVEVSQMQRLIIFLGHPVYGLCVVLFTLLLSSSWGSFTVHRIAGDRVPAEGTRRLLALLILLGLTLLLTPFLAARLESAPTPFKILVSVLVLFPAGFFMGMAFPLGMRIVPAGMIALSPWWWGINGAVSVCASVFEMVIALNFGISAAFGVGIVCYLAAFLSYLRFSRCSAV